MPAQIGARGRGDGAKWRVLAHFQGLGAIARQKKGRVRWKLGRNDNMDNVTIILGDALTELAKLPTQSVDLILTDPPYLAGDFSWMLPELLRIGKRLVLTPGKLESFNWIHRQGSADGWRNRAIAKACAGLARSQEWR